MEDTNRWPKLYEDIVTRLRERAAQGKDCQDLAWCMGATWEGMNAEERQAAERPSAILKHALPTP
ncbi:hypothetical protein [Streptomyces sp. NPDC017941]|uniref:hypothetical protein n=1 Tax=unclassified Streptomyces TaxID=2593676 RepID=UPI00379E7CF9